MAALEKYTSNAVSYELRHNTREDPHPSKNIDIDPSRTPENYYLTPLDHGRTARESKNYYNKRMKEVYHLNRSDVKTLCQWIITAPKDLDPDKREEFFKASYDFLNTLYGEGNCIQAVVHCDEGVKNKDGNIIEGSPHLHYLFIPVVENRKYMKPNKKGNITSSARFQEKVCADDLIDKIHLRRFHPDFQKYINERGINCTVYSGVTAGKNRTVKELKEHTRFVQMERELESLRQENRELKEKIHEYEQERPRWGRSRSNSREREVGRW